MLTVTPLSPDLNALDRPSSASLSEVSVQEQRLKDTAQSFEAAFIAQMLTFSGLADSMTSGEGQMASAFSSFFIEALADDMAESGAFGLADKLYTSLQDRALNGAPESPSTQDLL